MGQYTYMHYRNECLEDDIPPLTKREWEMEGSLTLKESQELSFKYHEQKAQLMELEFAN